MTTTVMRLAAVLVFALGTSACSTIDSTIDDVMGDAPAPPPATDANGYPVDSAPAAATSDAAAPTTPDLASVPDKPSGVTTPDDQKTTADSLAADRSRAHYSSDALRGGTEAAAAPPGAAPPPDTAVAANTTPPQPAPAAAPSDTAPAAAPSESTPAASADTTPPPSSAAPADSTPPSAPAAAIADNTVPAAAPPSAAPSTPVASMPSAPPPGTQPAVPAVPNVPGAQSTVVADANLGFKPSTAPPLDPSISQFVAAPIVARYQQTAANGGAATGPVTPSSGPDPVVASNRGRSRGRNRGVGGPEAMSGSVVANLDALNAPTASVYANASGMPPAAVVMFPNDGTALDAAGRAQVRAAVTAFQQHGGTGFIKVVGHSSSRTPNMSVDKHLVAIFAKSQARANAVAKEIIREGVPASRVLVEAVGDSQPVYYESMPQGEAGNRRAEIFIQG
ncbi:MAG: OmpA family protein [Rhizomicrobium sp.]